MLKHSLLFIQISAVLFISGSAYAESPVPGVFTPVGSRYQQFAEARNGGASIAERRKFDEEERSLIEPQSEIDDALEQPSMPLGVAVPSVKFTPLESMYSQRAGEKLQQFGYDLFGVPEPRTQMQLDALARNTQQMPMGAVQDDFILHAGDELEITFTGQRTDHGNYKINSQGLLVLPDMPPIPADGRAIGQVRLSIEAAARNLHNTDAYVSLSSVRQIGVLVIGHVQRPGRMTMTVFHTVIDALMQAGGVDKTGSLRQIKLVRKGVSKPIDLYAVLMRGGADIDLQLRDGDRIIVPSIGPTVAVSGEVKRPGIFEMLPGEQRLNLADMLDLGGGVLVPGRNRFLNMEVTRSGHEKASEIHEILQAAFSDGSMLIVEKGKEKRAGTVEITGHTLRPGLYALDQAPTLGTLFSSTDMLGPEAYPLIGVIEHRDPDKLARQLIAFPLRLVLKGEYDAKLGDGDKIHVFSEAQIRRLDMPAMLEDESEGKDPEKSAQEIKEKLREANKKDDKNDVLEDETLASFLRERSAFVRGAVRSPGAYPVADGITLDSLLAVAGGKTLEADITNIEVTAAPQDHVQNRPRRRTVQITDAANVVIRPGDAVRFNQKFQRVEDKSVLITGEVKNPGRYDLLPGDKLSDLMARAGGLTEQAYPDGAIFSRESERKAEESRFRAQAREIQSAVAAALEQRDDKIGAAQIAEARALASELETAQGVGRITVEADPDSLQQNPDLDMLLEAGDRLYVPKRTLTVRVSGEVLSPVTLQFRKNKEGEDYVDEAGGFTRNADKERSFVIYPDGTAQPLDLSGWSYDGDVFIPPGSTIIVPRDPEPFDFMQSAKDVSQILSNLAITALFIDDVRDDE